MLKSLAIALLFFFLADAGWIQTFADEFDGQSLNLTNWNVDPYKSWDQEAQQYMPDAFTFTGSTMKIIAQRKVVTTRIGSNNYTSGRITTKCKVHQAYGYWEMRAKTPAGKGFWPAFWLMDDQWTPNYNEIDIVEQLGKDPSTIYTTYHGNNGGAWGNGTKISNWDSNAFHNYGVQWIPNLLLWYVDGVNVFNLTNPQNLEPYPKYILVNMAIGGSWGGWPDASTTFPNFMEVDYVRTYKYVSSGGISINGPGSGISFTPEATKAVKIAVEGFTVSPQVASPGAELTFTTTFIIQPVTTIQYRILLSGWVNSASVGTKSGSLAVNASVQTRYTVVQKMTIPTNYTQPYLSIGMAQFDQSWSNTYWEDILTIVGINSPVGYSSDFPNSPVTTGSLTTKSITSSSLTTKSITSSSLTTKSITSSSITTKSITSAALTTKSFTSAAATTGLAPSSAYFVCDGNAACVTYSNEWALNANRLSTTEVRIAMRKKSDGFMVIVNRTTSGTITYNCNAADTRCQPWMTDNSLVSSSTSGTIQRVTFLRASDGVQYSIEFTMY